ncbi:MAG: GNAT family N-acetyltransferase [Alphaproteobacteria bacterium]|nr:GNAT family N-acetyltransferase [Alphaproteobacteria bacterium]
MEVLPLTGNALHDALPALADLRIRIFRAWPYLYDGTLDYEEKYLKKFSEAEGALVVVARDDNGHIVGASTASPLLGHADEFAAPFAARGHNPNRVFYFGESVLLPEYRGHGIGHKFFDYRENHARQSGNYDIAAFCAVVREEADTRKPDDYQPLDIFWNKRGFTREENMLASFNWKEIDSADEISHNMQFWIKKL